MAKVLLASGLIVAYGYMMETFGAFYSGDQFDRYMMVNRMEGPYAVVYWVLIACNIAIPQLLWIRRLRLNVPILFIVSLIVNVGMWLERFVIVVTSLHRDFMPSAWGMYYPTRWDWLTLFGSVGLFLTLLFLFLRYLPVISIFEMRQLVSKPEAKPEK
jgi:molybdopterin-containing oxidoreductase family membrane subunit